MLTKAHCFTVNARGRLRVLETRVDVRSAIDPSPQKTFTGLAIWDTGASATVITRHVIEACQLQPVGITRTHTANGERESEVFLVMILLPNSVVFRQLRVTVGDLGDNGPDLLIGMDVISHGDFAVTSMGGNTTFSFRVPSMEKIDFSASEKKRVGRNDLCPCGSGKKLKNCCIAA